MYGESLAMALMAAVFASHEASNRAVNSGLARWQLKRALEFLEAHLAEVIGLDELAHLVGISQSQFARAFKVSTGLPPYQWCFRNRVKRAQEMLLNGSDSLADIAIQNGFASKPLHQKVSSCDGCNPGELETSSSELRPITRDLMAIVNARSNAGLQGLWQFCRLVGPACDRHTFYV
jgi:AraC family transcriptional regulator